MLRVTRLLVRSPISRNRLAQEVSPGQKSADVTPLEFAGRGERNSLLSVRRSARRALKGRAADEHQIWLNGAWVKMRNGGSVARGERCEITGHLGGEPNRLGLQRAGRSRLPGVIRPRESYKSAGKRWRSVDRCDEKSGGRKGKIAIADRRPSRDDVPATFRGRASVVAVSQRKSRRPRRRRTW